MARILLTTKETKYTKVARVVFAALRLCVRIPSAIASKANRLKNQALTSQAKNVSRKDAKPQRCSAKKVAGAHNYYAPIASSNDPSATGKHKLSRTQAIPSALVASPSR